MPCSPGTVAPVVLRRAQSAARSVPGGAPYEARDPPCRSTAAPARVGWPIDSARRRWAQTSQERPPAALPFSSLIHISPGCGVRFLISPAAR